MFPILSRQFRSTSVGPLSRTVDFSSPVHSTSAVVASAFSPDLLCFYHGSFEVLKAMGVTGRVSCAGSTPAPSVLLTRTNHRVLLVELAGQESGDCGFPTRTKSHRTDRLDAAPCLNNLPG